jgi:hypothetical protein
MNARMSRADRLKNFAKNIKISSKKADTKSMTTPQDALLVDLDQYEDPGNHITLRVNRKNGTVLIYFNGKAAINLDAVTACEFAAQLFDAAVKSLKEPPPRKDRGPPEEKVEPPA